MMLAELVSFVRAQAGRGDHTPQEIAAAVSWALDALAGEAAKAAGPRMLFEFKLDILVDVNTYPLPDEIRTIKEVWHDGFDPPQGYTRIPYTGQSFLETAAAYAPAATSSGYAWWQTHRTLHIRPTPAESQTAMLRVAAYARPPLPRRMEDEVAIPWEAERWVIAKAASLILPPPPRETLEAILLQLTATSQDLEQWLWKHSASVPPAPLEDGLLV
jgi:hypothetical protein